MKDGNIRLTDVYADMDRAVMILWDLLAERTPLQSISHTAMPTLRQHLDFVESRPYKGWFIIWKKSDAVTEEPVGVCYLSNQSEIGIAIFTKYQQQGIAPRALRMLMALPWADKPKFLANINPGNAPSIRLFEKLGFKHIQNTYQLKE